MGKILLLHMSLIVAVVCLLSAYSYTLGPPFTQEQCQAAWMRDWLYAWSCSNLDIANKFCRASVTRGMSSKNFLNVLLHNMQDGNII